MGRILADIFTERLSGLDNKLVCSFKLAADMIGSGIKKFDKKCINKEERVRHLPGYCP